MKIISAEITMSAVNKSQYPAEGIPEIALVGRSNVGKSSTVNTLLNRRNFARTSQTPGKTRTINFYLINQEFYFVDLPGYGYAKRGNKDTKMWSKFIDDYIKKSPNLKLICLLVDIRHGLMEIDKEAYAWLKQTNVPVQVVATKLDKINKSQVQKQLKLIENVIDVEKKVIPFSSLNGNGRQQLLDVLGTVLLKSK